MGSLNSGLLNIDKEVITDVKGITEIRNISNVINKYNYNNYNELDKYKYNVREYWRNLIYNK